jgi:hypothetical protein
MYSRAGHYGARLTVANFGEVVARSEDQRTQFLADNPWVAQELDETVRRAMTLGPSDSGHHGAPAAAAPALIERSSLRPMP